MTGSVENETGPKRNGAKTAHFCSMKITEDVWAYAAKMGVGEAAAIELGMDEKSKQFREEGGDVYNAR